MRLEPGLDLHAIGEALVFGARRIGVLAAMVTTALVLGGCGGAGTMPAPVGMTAAPDAAVAYNAAAPFAVGVIPAKAPPIRIGDEIGFVLSAEVTGYGHLYLLNASGGVLVLAENLVMTAGAQTSFPAPGGDITLRASPPAGVERVLFLVTRQPFQGFGRGSGAGGPIQLAELASTFIANLNAATAQLPEQGWALAESRIEVVTG